MTEGQPGESLFDPPFAPDPDAPDWLVRPGGREERFSDNFGMLRLRLEADGRVRCRFPAEPRHRNVREHVHGGYIMAAIDHALFMTAVARGAVGQAGGVTLDCSTAFVAPGVIGPPLDVVGEVLRASGGHVFLRGLVEQEGTLVASFSGTVRRFKPAA